MPTRLIKRVKRPSGSAARSGSKNFSSLIRAKVLPLRRRTAFICWKSKRNTSRNHFEIVAVMVNALLVRVGADRSKGGGSWNGPVEPQSGKFAYVAIPETRTVYAGMEKPYSALAPVLSTFGLSLPPNLCAKMMHLDPDFSHLSYGDQCERAKQLRKLIPGDVIAFYSGLADVRRGQRLVYAMIGLFVVDTIVLATSVSASARDTNAHSRRILTETAQDLIVYARPKVSGRLERCFPIGEWRDGRRSRHHSRHPAPECSNIAERASAICHRSDGAVSTRSARIMRRAENPPT
jgi:hypothetical protein